MPTNKPGPSTSQPMTERRIAEFALEESRLSNLAYRFKLVPRERVWKDWDRTQFEQNLYRVVGLIGVCLNRDEQEKAHRTAARALEDLVTNEFEGLEKFHEAMELLENRQAMKVVFYPNGRPR